MPNRLESHDLEGISRNYVAERIAIHQKCGVKGRSNIIIFPSVCFIAGPKYMKSIQRYPMC